MTIWHGIAGALLMALVTTTAQANPLAPSPWAPQGVVRTDPDVPVVLQWRQQELALPNTNAPSRYFLLCVYVRGTSDCTSTSQRWLQTATTIQRVPVTRPATSGPPVVTAYDYSFSVALPPELIDVDAEWRVAACGSELESSCTFATRRVTFSTRDLHAVNISDGASTSSKIWVSGEVRNEGVGDSGAFETRLWLHDALADEFGRCITDLDAEGVSGRGSFVTTRGELIEIDSLPRDANGRPDASRYTIVAIIAAQSNSEYAVATHPGLAEGASATVVELARDLVGYSLPAAFVTRLETDSKDSLREYDERDNDKGECHTIFGE